MKCRWLVSCSAVDWAALCRSATKASSLAGEASNDFLEKFNKWLSLRGWTYCKEQSWACWLLYHWCCDTLERRECRLETRAYECGGLAWSHFELTDQGRNSVTRTLHNQFRIRTKRIWKLYGCPNIKHHETSQDNDWPYHLQATSWCQYLLMLAITSTT